MTTKNYIRTALFLALLSGLILGCGFLMGGNQGVIVALVFALAMNVGAYWFSDKIVLARYRAQPVTPQQAPEFHAIVDRLIRRANLPKPRLYVLPEEAPNAFATGRSPKHAAVAVTQGLLRMLNREELEGVIAHELAHVGNRDILIGSIAATIAGAVGMLAFMARWGAMFAGHGGRDNRGGGNIIALLVVGILAPLIAVIIQLAVSRSREYAADATGARFAGNSRGLARALGKLGAASRQIPFEASPASSHLFIVAPFSGRKASRLFSTHPALEERIRRLNALDPQALR